MLDFEQRSCNGVDHEKHDSNEVDHWKDFRILASQHAIL